MPDLITWRVTGYFQIASSIVLKSLRDDPLRKCTLISSLLRWSFWLYLAKTYRWIWLLLSRRLLWRTVRSSPSRLPRKGQPLPAWAFGTPRKDEMILGAVCPRWRRISAADRRHIPRHRISSPRNCSCCKSCSSATGKVCLRRKCGFGDRKSGRGIAIPD